MLCGGASFWLEQMGGYEVQDKRGIQYPNRRIPKRYTHLSRFAEFFGSLHPATTNKRKRRKKHLILGSQKFGMRAMESTPKGERSGGVFGQQPVCLFAMRVL